MSFAGLGAPAAACRHQLPLAHAPDVRCAARSPQPMVFLEDSPAGAPRSTPPHRWRGPSWTLRSLARRHAETLAATRSACSVESHAAAHTPAASSHYAASASTPGASAVPALISSTPFSPWIRTSESILRYRPLAGGDGVSHPVTSISSDFSALANSDWTARGIGFTSPAILRWSH